MKLDRRICITNIACYVCSKYKDVDKTDTAFPRVLFCTTYVLFAHVEDRTNYDEPAGSKIDSCAR